MGYMFTGIFTFLDERYVEIQIKTLSSFT